MKQNIRVLIYPDETGGYNVQCTDLSAYTQGDDLQDALANMHEALALALEGENLEEMGFAKDPSLIVEIELGSVSHLEHPEARRAG